MTPRPERFRAVVLAGKGLGQRTRPMSPAHRAEQPSWTDADGARIRALRERAELTPGERDELRALRRRETVEAFRRRRAFYRRVKP